MRYNNFYINITLVKNILVLLLFFLSYSCSPISSKIEPNEYVECPLVFFAAEHRNYLKSNNDENITFETLAFKAEINNYAYNKPCIINNNIYHFSLEVLLIADPIGVVFPDISMPVYVALLDSSNKIIEIQYFSVEGEFEKDTDSEKYLQTEISKIFNFKAQSNSIVRNLIIGFMLDKKQKDFLN